MRILVTGISGYVGSLLAPRLERDGHELLGLTRDRQRARRDRGAPGAGVRLVEGDAVSGVGLEQALEGVEVAYFLIHSMEPTTDGAFEVRDRAAAENFARAARETGVKRIIYLGGLVPNGGPASTHIASRLEVDQDRRRLSAPTGSSVSSCTQRPFYRGSAPAHRRCGSGGPPRCGR